MGGLLYDRFMSRTRGGSSTNVFVRPACMTFAVLEWTYLNVVHLKADGVVAAKSCRLSRWRSW